MSAGGWIASAFIVIMVGFALALPFIRGHRQAHPLQHDADVQSAYQRVLVNIRDLEEDFALGKITDGFYNTERQRLLAEGVGLLQSMHQLSPGGTQTAYDAIEAAVSAYRQKNS